MSLWWLQPGWTETLCARCGARIWPQGDPDHGVCFECYERQYDQQQYEEQSTEEPMPDSIDPHGVLSEDGT